MAIAVAELKHRDDMTDNHKENLVLFQVALRQRLQQENEFEPRILVTKSGRNCVDQILSGNSPAAANNPSERNIFGIAHETIKKFLGDNFPATRDLFNFVDYVFNKAYVLEELRLHDIHQAIRVFAIMNNRGRGAGRQRRPHQEPLVPEGRRRREVQPDVDNWDEASQTLFKCRLKRLRTMDFL